MRKIISHFINILFCVWVLTLCMILVTELTTWQDKVVAIIITLAGAHLIIALINRFLPYKIHLWSIFFEILSGLLLITGSIACIALFNPWPIKIIAMLLWIAIIFFLPLLINRNKE
ncbi:hypothetical protein ACP6OU_000460 [Cronobacter muytjensii]